VLINATVYRKYTKPLWQLIHRQIGVINNLSVEIFITQGVEIRVRYSCKELYIKHLEVINICGKVIE